MTRLEIEQKVLGTLAEDFEIENLNKDASLVDVYEFDSIDAINLLGSIEETFSLNEPLTIQEEREAMTFFLSNATVNQLITFIEDLIHRKKSS